MLHCSQLPMFSPFSLIIECGKRVVRELDASTKWEA